MKLDTKRTASKLTAGLSLEQVDLDLFEIRADEYFRLELDLCADLWAGDPQEVARNLAQLRVSWQGLIRYFEEREEFERCSVLKRVEEEGIKGWKG